MYFENNSDKKVSFDEVSFYFDGVASDRQDQFGLGRRTASIMALRERLLTVPEAEFNAIMKTLNKMVEGNEQPADQKNRLAQQKIDQANELYSAVNESHAAQSTVEEIGTN